MRRSCATPLVSSGWAVAAGRRIGDLIQDSGGNLMTVDEHHDYDTLTAEMHSIAEDHSDLVRLHGIGASVQGRQLWAMKITATAS